MHIKYTYLYESLSYSLWPENFAYEVQIAENSQIRISKYSEGQHQKAFL